MAATSTTAIAQQPGYEADRWNLDHRVDWLQERLNRAQQNGDLDQQQADGARDRLNDIRRDFRRDSYRDGGQLTETDRGELNARLDRLAQSLRFGRNADQYQLPWRVGTMRRLLGGFLGPN